MRTVEAAPATSLYEGEELSSAKVLCKELNRLYDEYGEGANIIDMLTDLRHLCDEDGYSFAECDRTAYDHYIEEIGNPKAMKGK